MWDRNYFDLFFDSQLIHSNFKIKSFVVLSYSAFLTIALSFYFVKKCKSRNSFTLASVL